MNGAKRILDGLSTLFGWIAGICVVAMMLHITADVTLRALSNRPLTGTISIVSNYYMVFLVCMPLAFVERMGGHVSVEVLTDRFPHALSRHLHGWTHLLTSSVFALVAYATWLEAEAKYRIGTFVIEDSLVIPTWLGYFALPVGYGLLAAYLMLKFLAYLAGDPLASESLIEDDEVEGASHE